MRSAPLGRLPRPTRATLTAYEAGAQTRRTLKWQAPTASPNTALQFSLGTLRDRSYHAVRNDGYAKGAIEALVTNIIGTGIKPLSQADDPEVKKAIHELWKRWIWESDADGLLSFYGQQTQAVRTWLTGGEAFLRFRPRREADRLSVALQLQVLEPTLCPYTRNHIRPNGNLVRAGIEFNRIGKRVGYWFHPSRPRTPLQDFDESQLVRLPASQVIHLYDPVRPGQLRGVPHLTPALIRLHELDKYDDATLLRQQLANLFAAFLRRPGVPGEGETFDPIKGEAIEKKDDDQILTLEAGIFQELAPGEEVQFSDPPKVGGDYADFVRQQLFHVAAATGVTYEVLTGDMSKVNDRTVRVILNEFHRRIMVWQHQIVAPQLCRAVWRTWLDKAFVTNVLDFPAEFILNPEPWARVKWIPQGWPYIHPVQDVESSKAAIRAGFTSRSDEASEQGRDSEEIDAQQADDNARADELGLKYDSDGRNETAPSSMAGTEDREEESEEEEVEV